MLTVKNVATENRIVFLETRLLHHAFKKIQTRPSLKILFQFVRVAVKALRRTEVIFRLDNPVPAIVDIDTHVGCRAAKGYNPEQN